MPEYLLVSDAVAPVVDTDSARSVAGLAHALLAAKHRVTIVSLGAPDHVARLPGMARRLRTVTAKVGERAVELPLYEGRSAHGLAQLYVLGAEPTNRGVASAVLATGSASLVGAGLLAPDVVIGWGETSASAVVALPGSTRFYVLPSGVAGPPLTADEREALGSEASMDAVSATWLVAWGDVGANALVVPSPTAARALERHPALAARASDQPVLPVRFGCDDPPHDPANDPALPAGFTTDALAGKAECRRTLARKAGLAVGPRTLVIAVAAPSSAASSKLLIEALPRLVRLDAVAAISGSSDRATLDQVGVLAIEHPGKIAVAPSGPGAYRALLAGADALLLTEPADLIGRAAGLSLRYGTLPIAPHEGAAADHLVDYDPESATGSALLYAPGDLFELEGAVRRATALRANADGWMPFVQALMLAAPRWSTTASMLEASAAALTSEAASRG